MPEVSNQYFDSREEIPKEERKIGSVVITVIKDWQELTITM